MSPVRLPHLASGKVRDIYELDDKHLTVRHVRSHVGVRRGDGRAHSRQGPGPDRHHRLLGGSAGRAWRRATWSASTCPPERPTATTSRELVGRVMVVRRAEMLPIECIVRGYLSGSAWAEYQRSQTMHGKPLPAGLRQSERLPEPVFTPSTKAVTGHDENISFEAAVDARRSRTGRGSPSHQPGCLPAGSRAGRGPGHHHRRHQVRAGPDRRAAGHLRRGPDARLVTLLAGGPVGAGPDAAGVRQAAACGTGWRQPGWDKTPPPPALPAEVVQATRDRYVEAYERLTGLRFCRTGPGSRERAG